MVRTKKYAEDRINLREVFCGTCWKMVDRNKVVEIEVDKNGQKEWCCRECLKKREKKDKDGI